MGRKPAGEGTEIVESKKRVAADGTQRGLKRKGSKNKVTQLIENIQAAVERDTGIRDWDPVVQMGVVAARAFSGYPATDDEGKPILDEDGNQVMVPPDPALAVAAAAKVAPYVHQQLRPREVGEDDGADTDPDEKRDRVLAAFENMGVKVQRDE
uniref:Terminase small subunit n=1 Tax=Dinoroseobacter phage vB_DshS_R26L TaxID=3161158 RepID=A0AAU7VGB3_9CAUD